MARAALAALAPTFVRVDVDFSQLEPAPGAPALELPHDGCLRGAPPCAAYAGLRDELAALASQQRAHPGRFQPVVVIYGVPAWAAAAPHGCERPGTAPRSRPINAAGLAAYRKLVGALVDLGRRTGVALEYWSAFNEPNHPYFMSPQRSACAVTAAPVAVDTYAALARVMRDELHRRGLTPHLLVGELAALLSRRPYSTSVAEWVARVPSDVLCSAEVFAVHDYARRGVDSAHSDSVGAAERALDRRGGCGQRLRIWVTETGAGAPHAGKPRPGTATDARASCHALAAELARLSRDRRVGAAFQYTFREDTAFPVGLADAALTRLYPAYQLWRAWAGRQERRGRPPPLPAACAG